MTQHWTLTIPAPAPWLNANARYKRRPDKEIRLWRDAAHTYAKAARLPALHQAHIIAVLHFTDHRDRDPHNFYPTIKAVVDGLVDYGLLPDDSWRYLSGPDLRMGAPVEGKRGVPRVGRLVLTIRAALDPIPSAPGYLAAKEE